MLESSMVPFLDVDLGSREFEGLHSEGLVRSHAY